MKSPKVAFALFGLCLVAVGAIIALIAANRGPARPSIEELEQQAVSGGQVTDQQRAVNQLTESGSAARPALRRTLRQAAEPEVKAASIQGLGQLYDYESMDDLLKALDDPSPLVRGRAGVAVQRLLGADFGFSPELEGEQLEQKITVLKKEWERMRGSRLLEDFKKRKGVE